MYISSTARMRSFTHELCRLTGVGVGVGSAWGVAVDVGGIGVGVGISEGGEVGVDEGAGAEIGVGEGVGLTSRTQAAAISTVSIVPKSSILHMLNNSPFNKGLASPHLLESSMAKPLNNFSAFVLLYLLDFKASALGQWGGISPRSPASRFSAASRAILVRVATEALAI